MKGFPPLKDCTVAVIGLGYVGLPLAVEFSKTKACLRTDVLLQRRVIGFDINTQRLEELRQGIDRTNETSSQELNSAKLLELTNDPILLEEADVFVVTVPTPIDSAKRPDLSPLEKASVTVGRALKQRRCSVSTPVVIYESTVFPGATEEVCVPILERESGLVLNEGFCCGYSPERINPGDNEHKLTTITKVTSGSSVHSAVWVDSFYGSIIEAGTHLAPSLKVAEAAKVIENTQRDLNIALINELAIIFRQLDIDTLDVLEAAGTKWNFLPFRPGLVGGHCIGVDPYYLTFKAEITGYHPQLVLAGRRINDEMASWVAEKLVLGLCKKNKLIAGAKVLILGLTFKENCPDLRNTKVYDLVESFKSYNMLVNIVDPLVDTEEVRKVYNLDVSNSLPVGESHDSVVLAVAHDYFVSLRVHEWNQLIVPDGIFFDLKGKIPRKLNPLRL